MLLDIIKIMNHLMFSISSVIILATSGEDTKLFRKKNLIISFVIFIVAIFCSNITNNILTFIFLLLTMFCVSSLINQKKLLQNCLLAMLTTMILCIGNWVATFVTITLLNYDLGTVRSNPVSYIIYSGFYYGVVFLLAGALKVRQLTQPSIDNSCFKTKILLAVIVVLQLMRIIIEYYIGYSLSKLPNLTYIAVISYMCSIFSIVLLAYCMNRIIDKENKIRQSSEVNEELKNYNEVLKYTIDNQRKIAHEHGNNLAVLSGYLENKDYDNAKKYIGKVIGQSYNENNGFLDNIKEYGLRALLMYKVSIIEKKGIDLELVIDEDIYDIIVPANDICNLMGIFLDNAIDASLETDEPFISINILKNESSLIISVMNSIKSTSIDKSKIFDKGYSTKGEGRGFGLNIVKDIIDRYEELELNTTVGDDLLFIHELTINSKKENVVGS